MRNRIANGRLAEAVLEDGTLDAEKARILWDTATMYKPKQTARASAVDSATGEYAKRMKLLDLKIQKEQIEVNKLDGSFINKAETQQKVFTYFRAIRDIVLAFPVVEGSQIAAEFNIDPAHMTAVLDERLRDYLNAITRVDSPFPQKNEVS